MNQGVIPTDLHIISRTLRRATALLMLLTLCGWCVLAALPARAANLVQLSPTTYHTEHAFFIIADPNLVTFPQWASVYSTANVNNYVTQLKAAFPDDYMMVVVTANQLTPNNVPSVITARSLASGIGQNSITGSGVPNICRYNLGGFGVFTPTYSVLDHEVGHNWGVQIANQQMGVGHWYSYATVNGQMADSYSDDGYATIKQIHGDPVAGFTWTSINNLTANETETFADQDLYAMGLHPIFPDTYKLSNPVYNPDNTVSHSGVVKYDHAAVLAINGPRVPNYTGSPKQFRFGYIYVARDLAEIQSVYAPIEASATHFENAEQIDTGAYRFQVPFLVNTKFRASINSRLADLDGNIAPTLTLGAGYVLSNDGNASIAYQAVDADGPAPAVSFVGSAPNAVIGGGNIVLHGLASGTYFFTVKAQDAGGKKAFAHFVVDVVLVNAAPVITSANSAQFPVLSAGTFSVAASGYPAPVFSAQGALPGGVTMSAGGVLSGTSASGSAGSYPITVVAANGIGVNAQQSFTLTVSKLAQAINFPALSNKLTSDPPFSIAATGTASGNLVTFGSQTPAVCQVSLTTVTLVGAGTCTLAADQGASADYLPATTVTASFTVSVPPPVIFTVIASAGANGTITPSGSVQVTQGNSAVFTVSANPGYSASIGGTCGGVLVNGVYTSAAIAANCTIVASFASVALLSQSINFAPLADVAVSAAPFTITATGGGSQLPVTFSTATPAVCTVSGNLVTIVGVGVCTIVANQAGNASYAPAPAIAQSFGVAIPTPGAPRNLVCPAGFGQISCSFNSPLSSGSSPIVSFTLTCTRLAGGAVSSVSGSGSPLALSLKSGALHLCAVTAANAQGTGLPSNSVFVTTISNTARAGGIDADGDGRAEIVVRAGGGNSFSATLDAHNQLVFQPATDPGAATRVLGAGDFAGVGHSDLLLQEIANGMVKIWAGFEGPPDGERLLRTVAASWQVEAIADVDGDGSADIVWRYTAPGTADNGVVFVWFMHGLQLGEVRYRGGAPLDWQLIGVGDLHGNGRGDIVWLSPTGQLRVLTALANRNYMNEAIAMVPAGYAVLRVGNFAGDGKAGLLLRNGAGKVRLWRMNGALVSSDIALPDTGPAWSFFATGDVDGDGTLDIVWKKADGSLVLWLMNKATPSSPLVVDPAGTVPAGAVAIEP
ncbi:MAG: hypothetical protein HY255_12120 [Betaproteobacteria bacterium]|nr:hypothetical protein [Betaproteobacteria bacterium]